MTNLVRRDIAALRETLSRLGLVVAEVDTALRYVWIDNPHPDFRPEAVIGKRDDELVSREQAAPLMAVKREILDTGRPARRLLHFDRSDGRHYYVIDGYPILDDAGKAQGLITCGLEIQPSDAGGLGRGTAGAPS